MKAAGIFQMAGTKRETLRENADSCGSALHEPRTETSWARCCCACLALLHLVVQDQKLSLSPTPARCCPKSRKNYISKVWVSIKFLSATFGLPPPPPKRAQNEEKTVQMSRKSSKLTLSPGRGGETQFYGQNDFVDIWAFLKIKT